MSTIPVDPLWWQTLFDDVYLITDARSVCNEELTQREVDFLEHYISPDKSDRILDLFGGQGRHSLELARRGFGPLTVLDYSQSLVNHGRDRARRQGLPVCFVQADARSTGLAEGSFDRVLVMANSFGYFPDDRDNLQVLKEAFRLCRPGGQLLLDLLDRNSVVRSFRSFSCHRASIDIAVIREREKNQRLIRVRESVFSQDKGLIRKGTYCERLFEDEELRVLLKEAGFRGVTIKRNFSVHEKPGDYGFMNSRMIITAIKPSC